MILIEGLENLLIGLAMFLENCLTIKIFPPAAHSLSEHKNSVGSSRVSHPSVPGVPTWSPWPHISQAGVRCQPALEMAPLSWCQVPSGSSGLIIDIGTGWVTTETFC